jgi:hypothetical protein
MTLTINRKLTVGYGTLLILRVAHGTLVTHGMETVQVQFNTFSDRAECFLTI